MHNSDDYSLRLKLAHKIAEKLSLYHFYFSREEQYKPLQLPFSYEKNGQDASNLKCPPIDNVRYLITEKSPKYGSLAYEKIFQKTAGALAEMEKFSGLKLDPQDYMNFLESCGDEESEDSTKTLKAHQKRFLLEEALRRVAEAQDPAKLKKLAECFPQQKRGLLGSLFASKSGQDIQNLNQAIKASLDKKGINSMGLKQTEAYMSYLLSFLERNPSQKAFAGLPALLLPVPGQLLSLAEKANPGALEAFIRDTVVAPDFQEISHALAHFTLHHANALLKDIRSWKDQISQRPDNLEAARTQAAESSAHLASLLQETNAAQFKKAGSEALTQAFAKAAANIENLTKEIAVPTAEEFQTLQERAFTLAREAGKALRCLSAERRVQEAAPAPADNDQPAQEPR